MVGGASEEARILEQLAEIIDPDLNRDIVSLGFIKDLNVRRGLGGSHVSFKIELTTPACPLKDDFKRRAEALVKAIDGIKSVDVTMTARVAPARGKRLPNVANIIAVGSGKGGVGKSTVAVNLALALRAHGARVGFLDADIQGPSAAVMLGLKDSPKVKDGKILPVSAFGLSVMTFAFFAPIGDAVAWRGAMLGKAVEQMLFDVNWDELDYLVVDLPPGTGDIHLTLIHAVDLAGSVVVSTPQDVALADTVRGIALFDKLKVPVLGLIENMSGFACPHCHEVTDVFGSGGVEAKATERGIPFLGRIPLTAEIRKGGDAGEPIVHAHPEHPVSKAFLQTATQVAHQVSLRNF